MKSTEKQQSKLLISAVLFIAIICFFLPETIVAQAATPSKTKTVKSEKVLYVLPVFTPVSLTVKKLPAEKYSVRINLPVHVMCCRLVHG